MAKSVPPKLRHRLQLRISWTMSLWLSPIVLVGRANRKPCRKSKARGYQPGRFSFNVKGGRCEACQGDGVIKIEMHFLPDVYVTCDVCKGKRYNRETLEIVFKGKSISDVLDMTVEEAGQFFKAVPPIRDKMLTLERVGLGYVKVGQSATTLSGGEAQRVKLAKELEEEAKRDQGVPTEAAKPAETVKAPEAPKPAEAAPAPAAEAPKPAAEAPKPPAEPPETAMEAEPRAAIASESFVETSSASCAASASAFWPCKE